MLTSWPSRDVSSRATRATAPHSGQPIRRTSMPRGGGPGRPGTGRPRIRSGRRARRRGWRRSPDRSGWPARGPSAAARRAPGSTWNWSPELFRGGRKLAVGVVALGAEVEARLLRQMRPGGRDERDPGPSERHSRHATRGRLGERRPVEAGIGARAHVIALDAGEPGARSQTCHVPSHATGSRPAPTRGRGAAAWRRARARPRAPSCRSGAREPDRRPSPARTPVRAVGAGRHPRFRDEPSRRRCRP